MKKVLTLILIGCLLSGCSFFRIHKMDVEQGNIISREEVARLRLGMSEGQVESIMGTPILVNIFTPNRMEYIYTYKEAYQPYIEKRVSLIFLGGRLSEIAYKKL